MHQFPAKKRGMNMADIELIIKIPEETYYATLKRRQLAICNDNDIYEWIKNGTPLPKGHGRLIDGDVLENLCCEHDIANSAFDGLPLIAIDETSDGDNIWKPLFDNARTIIEAESKE